MSSPYVYRPHTPLQYTNQFQHTPYYYTPQSGTPFIPDASLFPSSPYSTAHSLPGSPNRGPVPLPSAPNTPNRYAFPSTPGGYDPPYGSPWSDAYHRDRRPSWHGVNEGPWAPTYPIGHGGFQRRHSFGAQHPPQSYGSAPDWSRFQHAGGMLSPNSIYAQSQFHINPWLNAESPRSDFFFDLAPTSFSPTRLYAPGQSALFATEEMQQPATHPPLTALRIVCDMIPQWPIELALSDYVVNAAMSPNPYYGVGGSYTPPPISLADVLVAIHRAMHKKISHADWAKLDRHEEIAVSTAYTQRCKAVGSTAEHERAQGVKRVDFLLGRTRMRGLVRVGRVEGWETMKLIVT
ncbi:hypothetical protein Hypma_005171 [Hypsizygus marmoreus]|uniref:DUF6699 domain-containing protein n=1 Tax=Hypsizygus marmoreus TaxID=39966 RepID=A0A369K2P1_HYPMA|nr:hypothetical protein Hypma_005171 [Hypsizygus marmoreus]